MCRVREEFFNLLYGGLYKENVQWQYNSVLVTAPFGATAYIVGEQTIQREFKVNTRGKKHDKAKEDLVSKLMSTIALFFDEWSLISQVFLGSAEVNISSTAHNSGHESAY